MYAAGCPLYVNNVYYDPHEVKIYIVIEILEDDLITISDHEKSDIIIEIKTFEKMSKRKWILLGKL